MKQYIFDSNQKIKLKLIVKILNIVRESKGMEPFIYELELRKFMGGEQNNGK